MQSGGVVWVRLVTLVVGAGGRRGDGPAAATPVASPVPTAAASSASIEHGRHVLDARGHSQSAETVQ